MKVLWITNGPIIARHLEMMGGGHAQSGGWLVAAYDAMKDCNDVELGVVATYIGEEIKEAKDGNHTFYLLPCKKNATQYDPNLKENQDTWREVIRRFQPDVIHIWGTEFAYGTCALMVAEGIPSVVYMQGMMSQIANHLDGQLTFGEKLRSTTIRSITKQENYWREAKKYAKRVEVEKAMLQRVDGVIVENDWCAANCQILSGGCKVFKSMLPINRVFAEYEWNYEECNKHSIFTNAGPQPIKGHHMLFKALGIVKQKYPDLKVVIPGANYYFDSSLSRRLKRLAFHKHLLGLVRKYDLFDNLEFIGSQTQRQMAENMAKCNVFVMPSAIENHSSTLIEAMMVGAPTVSSNVGGVEEYYHNGENGLIYRYDEPEVLAAHIIRLFEDTEFAKMIGVNAKEQTREARLSIDLQKDFLTCYRELK